ncbi:MAG: Uma2 family endonuclease [Pseudonocardia sp.]|nr:Uma2 family endonuclease [Pseudonocardia sp.]
MSLQPVVPTHLLTVAEYLEIGELDSGYSELVEGRLLVSPSPLGDHNYATLEFAFQLRGQVPAEFEVITDIDVDLRLGPPDGPGTVRRPDLIVVSRAARRRQRAGGGIVTAADVLVVLEVLSPGSRRTDNVLKRSEYADAGIPHYWILDVTEPVSLLACHLAGEFGSVDSGSVTGTFTTDTPFPVTIDLDALL